MATQPAVGDPHALAALRNDLFHETGVDGVYARTGRYEDIVEALGALISSHRPAEAEVMRFPPVMSRADLERHGYLKSFPNLSGAVSCLCGDERHIRGVVSRFYEGEDWTAELEPADLVLAPAACYPVYPLAAARGPVPADGLTFDVAADCFRREPSTDIDRFQSFRMREYVRIGTPEQIAAFRDAWIERAVAHRRPAGPFASRRCRQRPVLRPRRPARRRQPAGAGAEVRARWCRCARTRSRPPA